VKTRFTLRLLSLAALGSLIVAGGNCADQRPPECTSPAAGHFTVALTATSTPPAGCQVDTGIVVATRSYYILDAEGNVDYDQPFNVAIQTLEMGEAYAHIEGEEARIQGGAAAESLIATNKLYAYGQFTTPQPDGNDQCYIPTLAPAVLEAPTLVAVPDDPETEEDDSVAEEPAFRLSAEWSDVIFLVSTAYPGVQFAGTLTLTRPHPETGEACSITYSAVAVSAVNTFDCSTPDQDDPETPDVNENPPYYREEGYNQQLCAPDANPDAGIPVGAGINPDFPIKCDPVTKLCLLDGPFRSGVRN
jgi:hypothetical protein